MYWEKHTHTAQEREVRVRGLGRISRIQSNYSEHVSSCINDQNAMSDNGQDKHTHTQLILVFLHTHTANITRSTHRVGEIMCAHDVQAV